MNFPLDRIELTETGIGLVAPDESRVDLCGKDVWELLKWMNWYVIELSERKEMHPPPELPPPQLTAES